MQITYRLHVTFPALPSQQLLLHLVLLKIGHLLALALLVSLLKELLKSSLLELLALMSSVQQQGHSTRLVQFVACWM